MGPSEPLVGPSVGGKDDGRARSPLDLDLKTSVEPRKLDLFERRCRVGEGGVSGIVDESLSLTPPRVTSVTPVPQRGENLSNLTDNNVSPMPLAVSFDRGNNTNDASNASCKTVHHANLKQGNEVTTTSATTASAAVTSSKKKSTPLKRPVSAIGDRHSHTTPPNRFRKGEHQASGGPRKKRAKKTEEGGKSSEPANTTVEPSKDGASQGLPPKHPPAPAVDQASSRGGGAAADQTSRSESRDTLFSYFPSSGSASNQGNNSNPTSQSIVVSSPPALHSKASSRKEKMGNQPTLHSFLKMSDKGDKKQQCNNGEEGRRGDVRNNVTTKEEANGDNATVVSASSSGSFLKPASDARAKKKKACLKSSHNSVLSGGGGGAGMQPDQSLHEIRRLQSQVSSLQKQLEDANARNNSIKNNQTLISANLQRQLKQQKAELEKVKGENAARMGRAIDAMERLVREGGAREAKELREKLASDGARLGRLVTSRVGPGGMGGLRGHHAAAIESWEDGHAPRALKARRAELRARREGLERRRRELEMAACENPSQSVETLPEDTGSSFTTETCLETDDLDRVEAREAIRMHLDEARRKEAELDVEERAMNLEKRGHVRALKLAANEDASKFRKCGKLHDRYVLLNLLGKGGFSEVWRAFDLHDMRHVAVKIHKLESSWSDAKKENYTKHVSREYEIHREVQHPRVVGLLDVFEIDADSFATVLECCGGTDLDTMLKDRGRLPERDARAILLQVLSGMRYLSAPSADGRRQGVIHYDLKPGNILFDKEGNAKITDFGLSKIVDNSVEDGDSMELTSQGAGTYWYLPPECFLMDQDVRISNKVDVWSIGVIYFQMLFGRRPFGDGQSQDHILRNQTMLHATEVHFPPKPPISEEGKAFIRDCLTYDQMSRPNMGQICNHGYLKPTSMP